MSNPVYKLGPINGKIARDLDQFHLVAFNAEGKIDYASAEGPIFGVISEDGSTSIGGAENLAVHYGPAAVYIKTDEAEAFTAGSPVYAAEGGKAASTGTVKVGIAVENGSGSRVLTILNGLPYSA